MNSFRDAMKKHFANMGAKRPNPSYMGCKALFDPLRDLGFVQPVSIEGSEPARHKTAENLQSSDAGTVQLRMPR
jgi:hypothetical protein